MKHKLYEGLEVRIDDAIKEFEAFCKRREEEKYVKNSFEIESVRALYNNLKSIQNN